MNNYYRHGVVSIGTVVGTVAEHWQGPALPQRKRPQFHGRSVGVGSLRLKTFTRAHADKGCIQCVGCGLHAKFFSVDSFQNQLTSAHLNLYGLNENGEEVLFTHDHILARALGGADSLENTQVMCAKCNNKKARWEGKEAERRRKEKEALLNPPIDQSSSQST